MILYTSSSQLTLEGFQTPFEQELNPENRWVILSELIPWDDLASQYSKCLVSDGGRNSIDIRCVIGAVIIKHKEKLSDRGTTKHISENLYMQYFCGMQSFTTAPPFDSSLFVTIRKRLGKVEFNKFHLSIIEAYDRVRHGYPLTKSSSTKDKEDHSKPIDPKEALEKLSKVMRQKTEKKESDKKPRPSHHGKLKLDATVADQYIKYPTDLNLLNESRENLERMIDRLYHQLGWTKKPRTYRRKARQAYLTVSKKKSRSKKIWRRAIRLQLQYVRRDIKFVHKMLDAKGQLKWPLGKRDQRLFWVIQLVYDQQKYMYDNQVHSHPNRIVNLHQPYVRPIVRGKDKHKVEFGAKLSVSEIEGMCRVDIIHWEAANESKDLKAQVEAYKQTHGYYPEVVITDGIYGSRENRLWLKELGLRYSGKPLGRPPKIQKTPYQKTKQRKELRSRNHIEGKFGQAKNGYRLNQVRAKRQDTSESWIHSIFMVMNLVKMYQWYKKSIRASFLSNIKQIKIHIDGLNVAQQKYPEFNIASLT